MHHRLPGKEACVHSYAALMPWSKVKAMCPGYTSPPPYQSSQKQPHTDRGTGHRHFPCLALLLCVLACTPGSLQHLQVLPDPTAASVPAWSHLHPPPHTSCHNTSKPTPLCTWRVFAHLDWPCRCPKSSALARKMDFWDHRGIDATLDYQCTDFFYPKKGFNFGSYQDEICLIPEEAQPFKTPRKVLLSLP